MSERPNGLYEDLGPLVNQAKVPFSIDPHPFQDADGQWYLFYATDFLNFENGNHIGTGQVVDRLQAMTSLAGQAEVVGRARHAWQLFQAQRKMYGRVYDWHTLKGPFVRWHERRYYCFYSGGNYQNNTYGVDYFVSESVMGLMLARGAGRAPACSTAFLASSLGLATTAWLKGRMAMITWFFMLGTKRWASAKCILSACFGLQKDLAAP